MTTKSDVLEMILNGENSYVEFKREAVRDEDIAREIAAFANTDGGRLLIGVEDDGSISGISDDKMLQDRIMNIVRDRIRPFLVPLYEGIALDEKRVAVITITRGPNKPYVCILNNRDEYYIRMGNRCERARREQMARLFASGGMLHVEVSPVSGTSLRNLDKSRLTYYLHAILHYEISPSSSDATWIERLAALDFLVNNGMDDFVCTIAGLVLFAKRPRLSFPSAGLRFISYAGKDRNSAAVCDVTLDNALVSDRQQEEDGTSFLNVGNGLVEDFLQVATPFLSYESDLMPGTFQKERIWHYPFEAVREVLINAFIHRDWTSNLDVTVENYSDRLEITSPGRLQNSMTVEKMLAGQRSPRNTILVDVMKDYGYVDARGMGIRSKVVPLMREKNGVDPVIKATEDYVRFILYRKSAM